MSYQHNIISGSKTNSGLTTQFNSDAMVDFPIMDGHVFVVSDGHDGENGHGALAAKICVESIKKYFLKKTYKNISNALTNAVTFANYSIYDQALKDPKYKGFASTIAILICYKDQAYYAYAGDSRIYCIQNEQLKALTKDHKNEVGELSVLVGKQRDIKFGVCIKPIAIKPDAVFLVCTDGLSDKVSEEEMLHVLSDADTFPEHKALQLTEKALASGEEDNVTVQVVEFGSKDHLTPPNKERNPNKVLRTVIMIVLSVIGALALSIGGYQGYAYLSKTSNLQENSVAKKEKQKKSDKNKIKVVVGQKGEQKKVEVEEPEMAPDKNIEEEPKAEKVSTAQGYRSSVEMNKNFVENSSGIHKHKIKYGENLYRLGLRYNVSQNKLIELNGEKATNLVAGAYLEIPIKAVCTVQKGESWSVISDRYNIKISSIAKASRCDASQALKEGQKLIVPLK